MYCKIKNTTIRKLVSRGKNVFPDPDKVKVLAIVKGNQFCTHLLEANWSGCTAPKRAGTVMYEVPGLKPNAYGDLQGGYWVNVNDIEIREVLTNREAVTTFSLDSSY